MPGIRFIIGIDLGLTEKEPTILAIRDAWADHSTDIHERKFNSWLDRDDWLFRYIQAYQERGQTEVRVDTPQNAWSNVLIVTVKTNAERDRWFSELEQDIQEGKILLTPNFDFMKHRWAVALCWHLPSFVGVIRKWF